MERTTVAIVNGHVWGAPSPTTALAVSGERVSALGTDLEIKSLVDNHTRLIDALGATILPAFNDAHVHFLMASRALAELDLFGAETQSEIERRVERYARHHTGAWIVGRGWFYHCFPENMPTVELLDRLIPDRPAYIESYDAHTAWANSIALRIAGAPPGAVLKEAAMRLVTRHIPVHPPDEDLDALRAGMHVAGSKGVASVQEAGDGQRQFALWHALHESGEQTVRVRLAFDMTPGTTMDDWARRLATYQEARLEARGPWLATGILKAFADGVVESRTASVLSPYAGDGGRGEPLWDGGELAEAVRLADAAGWQVQVHAIGDSAIRDALDSFQGTAPGRRHRIEHIEAPAAADIPRFGSQGVIASMQPQHAEPNQNLLGVWALNLGPERASRGWPCRSIARSGGMLAFGTDWPVVPLDPAASLHVAVNRQTPAGEPKLGWLPHERLELAAAVEAWTYGSAYAEHAEDVKGTLGVGMLADIAVLDRALASIDPSELAALEVQATVVGGRVVYER